MKKVLKWLLPTLVSAALIAAGLFLWLADEETLVSLTRRAQETWAWVEANVLSDMLASVALIGIASVELIPAIKSFVKSKAAFAKVARDVEAYTAASLERDLRQEAREEAFYARMEELRLKSEERMQRKEAELEAREARLQEAIEAFRTLAEGYNQNLMASEDRLSRVLRHVEVCSDKTERMVYLGFSNSCELVRNGTARKVAEVEEQHEE